MNYSFDVAIAEKYGVNEAIMIQNFAFWISKSKANNKHFHDGKIWTYNSKRAYSILFPFWSERQVRIILESLIKQGVLIKGNYNQSSYDRTLWYAFNDNTIGLLDTFHWTEASNQLDGSVQPIPDINSDINTNKENTSSVEVEKKRSTSTVEEWPDTGNSVDKDLKDFLLKQPYFKADYLKQLLHLKWWDALSETINGLDFKQLDVEFARMNRWIIENPKRTPTVKGFKRFVSGWLERGYEKERRNK